MRRLVSVVFTVALAVGIWQVPASQAAPKPSRYIALLSAGEVVPGPGDSDGDGDINITIGSHTGTLCWFMNTTNVAAPLTAVHLHKGPRGVQGETVAQLHGAVSDPDPAHCTEIGRTLAKDLISNPGAYYVDVHNHEHPDGALRAQLDNGAPVSFFLGFEGASVVPGPGDGDGGGGGPVGISGTDTLCFSLTVNNVSEPMTMHLHRGGVGETGGQVALLNGPSADYRAGDCVEIGADLVSELSGNPQAFYIDVHTDEFPDGAVRSQLQ